MRKSAAKDSRPNRTGLGSSRGASSEGARGTRRRTDRNPEPLAATAARDAVVAATGGGGGFLPHGPWAPHFGCRRYH